MRKVNGSVTGVRRPSMRGENQDSTKPGTIGVDHKNPRPIPGWASYRRIAESIVTNRAGTN